jgi:hypothetical protein
VLTTLATVGSEFHREIVHSGRLAAFVFFVALLGTFGFIRASTHMIKAQVKWWPGNVSVGGTHVHHLVWGIVAMMIFGYIGVVHSPESPWREIVAAFFGIGAGLTLDEFALWLELKDVYWEKDGRKSVDAMIVAGCLAAIGLVGLSVWARLADDVEGGVLAAVGAVGAVAIAVALVNVAKEKFVMALVALLFWPAAVVTAIRLAKPHSIWARWFYRDHRQGLAEARYPTAEGAGSPEPADASVPGSEPSTEGQSSS